MKTILREDESGVSEVVGTILILAMTVVLFSTIILWVGSVPTPTVQPRVDLKPSMAPVFDGSGNEIGVNITMLHRGVESLNPAVTRILVTWTRGTDPPNTDQVILHLYNPALGTPSGLLDGTNAAWDIGERWAYVNFLLRSSDAITVTVIDQGRNIVVWSAKLISPAGNRAPVFVSKWVDDISGTLEIEPIQATKGYFLYAHVIDLDNDLNPNSVRATLTMFFGTGDACESPQKLHDDGVYPDRVAGDDVFTLGAVPCMSPPFPLMPWDGSIILLNATDLRGHETETRFVLHVVEPITPGEIQTIPTELWQYIGFIQVRTGEVWWTRMNQPYSTTNQFQVYRVTRTDLNGNGGALFHLSLSNHGNRTIFIDGWTTMTFSATNRASVFNNYIVRPVDSTRAANNGGIGAYPGSSSNPAIFAYNQVLDINPVGNQEKGGTPVDTLFVSPSAFSCCTVTNWVAGSYFMNVLISGIVGPQNMTYQQIIAQWGSSYNPYDYLLDPNPAFRTQWYAQVIPFIGMTVYG